MTRSVLYLFAIGIAASSPIAIAAQPVDLNALSALERGEWELHELGNARAPRRACISDTSQFLQPQHPNRQCRLFIVRNGADRASITYDCAGAGQGRTEVRVETSRLVQISSQGVSNGTPFSLRIEGRHMGACKAPVQPR